MNWLRIVALAACAFVLPAQAQELFRIGTGGTVGTYYPVGSVIANAVSAPGDWVAVAVPSSGSVANINGILDGSLDAGFVQADVAYWAYSGTGMFAGKPAAPNLRLIATLYPESIHLVARKGAGIKSVADLKDKRVSLDENDSGTQVNARLILGAYGLTDKDVQAEYLSPDQAGDRMKAGKLDAFFFIGGAPAGAIAELAAGVGIDLVPLAGPEIDKLRDAQKFLAPNVIPADTYRGVGETRTLAVSAQLVTSDKQPEARVYALVKKLYSEAVQKPLAASHAKGRFITPAHAVTSAAIPFHPGAARYYREAGLLK